jgi:demethylmenaquinone methyltransferase/2-methoxy-6-polyprenyl-1,4-benzoquinol methylase
VVALSDLEAGDKVLDVCTGTGELALAFSFQGADVTGIDISRGMLSRATRKDGHQEITWLEMNATQLQFQDKTFDISTISLALHHMPEPVQRRVLSEMARVTRRQIVIVEPHTPANPRLWSVWAAVASWFDESEHMLDWARQDFARTCQTTGLKIERVQVTTFGLHRITLCTPMISLSYPNRQPSRRTCLAKYDRAERL